MNEDQFLRGCLRGLGEVCLIVGAAIVTYWYSPENKIVASLISAAVAILFVKVQHDVRAKEN